MSRLGLIERGISQGFYPIEIFENREWAWSRAGESEVAGSESGWLDYHFQVPAADTTVKITLNGKVVRTIRSDQNRQDFTGRVQLPAPWKISFSQDRWNGNGAAISEIDTRELGLMFFRLKAREQLPLANEKSLKGKICPIPFSRLESLQPFAPCNRWFLTDEILLEEPEADPWNGRAAKLLRESIYDGSYRYCKRDICQEPLLSPETLERAIPAIHPENIKAIRSRSVEMPKGPTRVAIMADPRCNLACATCRPHSITVLSQEDQKEISKLETLLEEKRDSIQSITFAVNGDVFFSPYLRDQLKHTTRDKFPNFQYIEILSNGLLFDQKALDQLRPGSDFIKRVCITVDAGNAETYSRVRGGNWQRLVQNLEWMSEQRLSGRFSWLRLVFIVRKGNYSSLPEFFELAERLKVDDILLSRLQEWTEMKTDFKEEAVCQPEHPENEALGKIWLSLKQREWNFKIVSNLFWDYHNRQKNVHFLPIET
ncbi:MAG: radical SAM protein [Bdellovibrionota bacterium]